MWIIVLDVILDDNLQNLVVDLNQHFSGGEINVDDINEWSVIYFRKIHKRDNARARSDDGDIDNEIFTLNSDLCTLNCDVTHRRSDDGDIDNEIYSLWTLTYVLWTVTSFIVNSHLCNLHSDLCTLNCDLIPRHFIPSYPRDMKPGDLSHKNHIHRLLSPRVYQTFTVKY